MFLEGCLNAGSVTAQGYSSHGTYREKSIGAKALDVHKRVIRLSASETAWILLYITITTRH